MTEDDQDVENAKCQRRNDQEINGGSAVQVVPKKRLPGLIRIGRSPRQVSRDRGLANVKSQLQQFSMNARCAPQRIVCAHPPNEQSDLAGNYWPAISVAGFPTPVETKPLPVPTHDRPRMDDCDEIP